MLKSVQGGIAALLLAVAGVALAAGPVAKVSQVDGSVEFSRDGENWRAVTRNKYLFEGQLLRTGGDGSGMVLNQETGVTHELGANTTIQIGEGSIAVVSGSNFSEPEEAGGSFWQAMANKFSTTQRYTTVRRSVRNTNDTPRIDTARTISLSAAYPELVWTNAGPEYAYRLTIDEQVTEVAPVSTGEMIRFSVEGVEPGEHSYMVELVLDGEVVYAPRRPSTFTWLGSEEESAVMAGLEEIQADPLRNDAFVIADYLETHALLVGAMDVYREFFAENPDENDMRPFLIKAYHDLKLLDLKEKEAITYNTVETQLAG